MNRLSTGNCTMAYESNLVNHHFTSSSSILSSSQFINFRCFIVRFSTMMALIKSTVTYEFSNALFRKYLLKIPRFNQERCSYKKTYIFMNMIFSAMNPGELVTGWWSQMLVWHFISQHSQQQEIDKFSPIKAHVCHMFEGQISVHNYTLIWYCVDCHFRKYHRWTVIGARNRYHGSMCLAPYRHMDMSKHINCQRYFVWNYIHIIASRQHKYSKTNA